MSSTAYLNYDRAVVAGHIVYLYKFIFKNDFRQNSNVSILGFCTGREEVTYQGVTYLPRPVVHGDIKLKYGDTKATVKVPATPFWAELFIATKYVNCELEILRYRRELNEAITIFRGSYLRSALNQGIIEITFGLGLEDINCNIITYWVQRTCNHIFGDVFCGGTGDYKSVFAPPDISLDAMAIHFVSEPPYIEDFDYWLQATVIISSEVYFEDVGITLRLYNANTVASWTGDHLTANTKYDIPEHIRNGENLTLELIPNCLGDLARCAKYFGRVPRSCGWPDMPSNSLQQETIKDLNERDRGEIGTQVHY